MKNQIPGSQFREFLRAEWRVRQENNPSFSLRSFAKYVGVSPSGLSMVLGAKKPVTLDFIEKVGRKLKLDAQNVQSYQLNLLNEKSSSKAEGKAYQKIDADTFAVIKDWYHYAILNLMRTKGFKPSPTWVARRLGISLAEAQSAVERLEKVGILKIQNGKWQDLSNQFTTHTDNKNPLPAAKENQKQIFAKATAAIEEVRFEDRNHTGVTLAVRLKDLESAKNYISQFRKSFTEKYDQVRDADEVYQISVALFPLTKMQV